MHSHMQIDPRLLEEDPQRHSDAQVESPDAQETHLGYNPQLENHRTYDADLHHDRSENRQILKRRFEHIFAKYERDFEGIGDEIDLITGDIVINNGHVRNMRHEADTGVRTLRGNLGARGDVDNLSDRDEDPLTAESMPSSALLAPYLEDSQQPTLGEVDFSDGDGDSGSATSCSDIDELSFNAFTTNVQGSLRATSAHHAQRLKSSTPSFAGTTSCSGPLDILHQIPGLEDSVSRIQRMSESGQSVDPDAVQMLGNNIAKHVSQYISNNSARLTPMSRVDSSTNNTWAYPLLPEDKSERRKSGSKKSSSKRLPPLFSPTRHSLWAPVRHPAPRKRKKDPTTSNAKSPNHGEDESMEFFSADEGPAETVSEPLNQVVDNSSKVCRNCGFTGDTTWRFGGDREDLCNSCGMYLYRYELHRPQEPFSESEREEDLNGSDIEINDSITAPVESSRDHIFSLAEDVLLLRLKEIEFLPWPRIGKHFPSRTPWSIQCRYSKTIAGRSCAARKSLIQQGFKFPTNADGEYIVAQRRRSFAEEDEDLLLKLRDEDGLDWPEITFRMQGFGLEALQKQYGSIAKRYADRENDDPFAVNVRPQSKKKSAGKRKMWPYTRDEDALLLNLREGHKMSWVALAESFPGRTHASLQKRYTRELRPLRKGPTESGVADGKEYVVNDDAALEKSGISTAQGYEVWTDAPTLQNVAAQEPALEPPASKTPTGIEVITPMSLHDSQGKDSGNPVQASERCLLEAAQPNEHSSQLQSTENDSHLESTAHEPHSEPKENGTSCPDEFEQTSLVGTTETRTSSRMQPEQSLNAHVSEDTDATNHPSEEGPSLKDHLTAALRSESRDFMSIRQIQTLIRNSLGKHAFTKDEMRVHLADSTVFEEGTDKSTRKWRIVKVQKDETNSPPPSEPPPSDDDADDVIVVKHVAPGRCNRRHSGIEAKKNSTVQPKPEHERRSKRVSARLSRDQQELSATADPVAVRTTYVDPPRPTAPASNANVEHTRSTPPMFGGIDLRSISSPASCTALFADVCEVAQHMMDMPIEQAPGNPSQAVATKQLSTATNQPPPTPQSSTSRETGDINKECGKTSPMTLRGRKRKSAAPHEDAPKSKRRSLPKSDHKNLGTPEQSASASGAIAEEAPNSQPSVDKSDEAYGTRALSSGCTNRTEDRAASLDGEQKSGRPSRQIRPTVKILQQRNSAENGASSDNGKATPDTSKCKAKAVQREDPQPGQAVKSARGGRPKSGKVSSGRTRRSGTASGKVATAHPGLDMELASSSPRIATNSRSRPEPKSNVTPLANSALELKTDKPAASAVTPVAKADKAALAHNNPGGKAQRASIASSKSALAASRSNSTDPDLSSRKRGLNSAAPASAQHRHSSGASKQTQPKHRAPKRTSLPSARRISTYINDDNSEDELTR